MIRAEGSRGTPRLAPKSVVATTRAAGGAVMAAILAMAAPDSAPAGTAPVTQAASVSTLPDWNGVWVLDDEPLDQFTAAEVGTLGEDGPPITLQKGPILKGEYAKRAQARMRTIKAEAAAGVERSSTIACLPSGMPDFWGGPYAFEIIQTPRQINLYQEFLQQIRRIYLDGRPDPKDLEPSYFGRSIGKWEGGALIVTTTGLKADTQIGDGVSTEVALHSDAMRIVERFRSSGPGRLEVKMTVEDPKAFAQPWVRTLQLHRAPTLEILEFLCENNLDAQEVSAHPNTHSNKQ